MPLIIAVLVVLVTQVSIPANAVEAAPEKRLDNALQADDGSEIIKHLSKMEAAISDNSKSLSSIRQAVQANTKVEAAPEKSLDKALQADAGREFMKNLGKMEAAISDTSKSLSNIRQAVQANTKDEAVPAILKRALQADPGSDLLKILNKTINDISKSQSSMKLEIQSLAEKFESHAEKIQSNTEKIGSVESRMITCQVGNVYIFDVQPEKWTKGFPIKLTGFTKTPKMEVALKQFSLQEGGTGVLLYGEAKSPTSAEIKAYGKGGVVVYVMPAYVACGN